MAEFPAPAVIISADRLFTRFGMANTAAITSIPYARKVLEAAGFEATITEIADVDPLLLVWDLARRGPLTGKTAARVPPSSG